MKVGFFQYSPKRAMGEYNIFLIDKAIKGISTDVLVFPELFLSGYLFESKEELLQIAELAGSGSTYKAMVKWAKQINGMIVGGFPEIHNDDIFNSTMAVMPDGEFILYRKIHLFDSEKLFFKPGNIKLRPFKFRNVSFGMLICFDWIFPETYRTLALAGAQVILHSANLIMPYSQKASYARAVENRVFIILANRIGEDEIGNTSLKFTGSSIIYDPKGNILKSAPEDENYIGIVEINPNDALDKYITQRNHIFQDRRVEFYELD